ncbi:hypothetical protein BpHYR1_007659 [Brachionus plicatilis]|uniref:Uncharacterized protein n=1 Tax=Brachionus plicatilis TaxID=10195 RepID=A0A3M7TA68_BRAPC|nr:hypothetical protein BpHYR1_007659 [Brachionus plicatilis]
MISFILLNIIPNLIIQKIGNERESWLRFSPKNDHFQGASNSPSKISRQIKLGFIFFRSLQALIQDLQHRIVKIVINDFVAIDGPEFCDQMINFLESNGNGSKVKVLTLKLGYIRELHKLRQLKYKKKHFFEQKNSIVKSKPHGRLFPQDQLLHFSL